MIGLDSSNNLYLADDSQSRVARFALPYRYQTNGTDRCCPRPTALLRSSAADGRQQH